MTRRPSAGAKTRWPAVDHAEGTAETEGKRKGTKVTAHLNIEDHDDRPERMLRDPDRYFADARRRALQEVMRQARWLFPSLRNRKQP
jgi:hypothetical protein